MTAALPPVVDVDAKWQLTVPVRKVGTDGTVTITAQLVDSVSGDKGTMTWTLTPDRESQTVLDIPGLSTFEAWSKR